MLAEWLFSSGIEILQAALLTLKSFSPKRPLLDEEYLNSEGFTAET